MTRLLVLLALSPGCAALATPPTAMPCLLACARELHPTSLSVSRRLADGREECRCWAPLAPGEAPRPATARIVLP